MIDPDLQQAEELRRWLGDRSDDTISLIKIYQLGPSRLRQADKARAAMGVLAEHGWVIPLPDGARFDGKFCREA